MLSLFNTNFSLRFVPYRGTDSAGLSQYDNKRGITVTVNYEGAALLYQTAMLITNGNVGESINAVLQCNNNAVLVLEYKPGQDGQSEALMTANKNNESISYKFQTHTVTVKENGHDEPS